MCGLKEHRVPTKCKTISEISFVRYLEVIQILKNKNHNSILQVNILILKNRQREQQIEKKIHFSNQAHTE